jgi:hypothetical protein
MNKSNLPANSLLRLMLCVSLGQTAWAQPAAVEMAGTLVQVSHGELARLGANKRVALTGCMVEYQTSVQVQDGGSMFNRNTTTTVNSLTAVPKDTLQEVTNRTCGNLRQKLAAAGFTVLPQTEVAASPVFAQILTLSGVEGVFGLHRGGGGALLFADAAMPQYLPYIGEGGGIASNFVAPPGSTYEKALPDAKPAPDGFGQSRKYDLPKLEVELAKSLNAHLLKAWTVIGFGSASASSERDWSAFRTSVNHLGEKTSHTSTNFKGEGDALFSVGEHQTRLAIRLADGKADGHAGMVTRGPKLAPTDGDIVIKLAAPVLGGNSFLTVEKGEKPAESGALTIAKGIGALLGAGGGTGLGRGSHGFHFETKISKPDAYRDTAVFAIGAAHDGFIGTMAKP